VHTSAKPRLTSVAIWIRIRIRDPMSTFCTNVTICSLAYGQPSLARQRWPYRSTPATGAEYKYLARAIPASSPSKSWSRPRGTCWSFRLAARGFASGHDGSLTCYPISWRSTAVYMY